MNVLRLYTNADNVIIRKSVEDVPTPSPLDPGEVSNGTQGDGPVQFPKRWPVDFVMDPVYAVYDEAATDRIRTMDAAEKAAWDIVLAAQAAEAAARAYPMPDVTVPMVDADGNTVGTARIVVDALTLETICVVNSASPQRTWTEQKAKIAARAIQVRQAKGKVKPNMSDKEKLDAMWQAMGLGE